MTILASTGLRDHMLATGSLKGALDGGFIRIYSGAPPASADDAVTGTLLWTISLNATGTGITLVPVTGTGTLQKNGGEVWSGTVAASGVASYYRHVAASDTGVSSTTQPRLQGSVGVAGTDLVIGNVSLVATALQAMDYYSVALPA